MKRNAFSYIAAIGGALFALNFASLANAADDVTVITLTQTPCQFIEAENGVDHGFTSTEQADCEKINAATGDKRVAESDALTLKPGKYIFRVTNKNVPYSLGFWLREEDYNWANPIHKLSKISVSGGGLDTGTTLDYEVELKEGEYLYSCPLNTTPDYKLHVKS
ncbi:MAG: hypothetical protein K9G33_00295 [Sneathiella sp.]|nr:hypothetical protein [Sneathiella sp.]